MFESVAVYLVDFLQHQQTDLSTLVFNVHLTELMSVSGDKADFSNSVLVAYSVKEVVDPVCKRLSEHVI